MTIQIPDDVTRGLESLATLQKRSIEEVAIESLRLLFGEPDSPTAIVQFLRSLPHPSAAAVDDMEAAIMSAQLPVRDALRFDP